MRGATTITVNGIATLLILLLFIHFIYNVYIQKRTTSATIIIKINNDCHFKTVSIIQTLIFILSLISCIIGTFFISNLIVSTLSSNTCSIIYLIFYYSWFIAQYLVLLMFIFRLYNIAKILSSKWKNILISLAIITTVLNIAIIIIYAYISSPYLTQTQSSNNTLTLCTDDTHQLHTNASTSNYLSFVILNSINTLIIICIFIIYIHQFYFIKHRNISSIYSYSYLSLSTTGKERQNVIRIDDEKADSTPSSSCSASSDVISSAIVATLQNAEVTIGTNRRKRNYTSNTPTNNQPFIGKVKVKKIEKNVNVDENTNIILDIKQNNGNNIKHEQYVGDLRFVVEKEFILETIFVFVIIICFLMQFMDDIGVMMLYLNGINAVVNCLCSVMLFNYNNDLWYDILRCIQCYCFYDCCWRYCKCFIWDKQKNCGTFCCSWVTSKGQENDNDNDKDNSKNNELNENENNNKKSEQQKSIYVRGSLRRLH